MSYYGLIKEAIRITRGDSATDLRRINEWLYQKGKPTISCYGSSIRSLENSIALGLEKIDIIGLPKLVLGESFYQSILSEIKKKDRLKFNKINSNLR